MDLSVTEQHSRNCNRPLDLRLLCCICFFFFSLYFFCHFSSHSRVTTKNDRL